MIDAYIGSLDQYLVWRWLGDLEAIDDSEFGVWPFGDDSLHDGKQGL